MGAVNADCPFARRRPAHELLSLDSLNQFTTAAMNAC
jgi:hypothetical protein